MHRLFAAFLLVTAVFGGGLIAGSWTVRAAAAEGADPYAPLSRFARTLVAIQDNHVSAHTIGGLADQALDGLVEALDPHSHWFTADEWATRQADTEGEGEVGVELRRIDGQWVVERLVPGAPAALAGIQAADVLQAVEGEPTTGLDEEELHALLQGPRGSGVLVSIIRDQAPMDVTIVRDLVLNSAVHGERGPEGCAYIRVAAFQRHVAADVHDLLQRWGRDEGLPSSLVLDLRNNGGGLIDEAVAMADLFLESGTIVEVAARNPAHNELHTATEGRILDPARTVILVNGNTASGAELLAGALRIGGGSKILGSHTYGKGTLQRVYELDNGAAMSLTVAHYLLDGGVFIAPGEGLTPDIAVDAPAEIPWTGTLPHRASLDDQLAQALAIHGCSP
jgi:carboxyl-terminal processing protease